MFSLLPLLGIFFVLPCIESYQKVDLRTITLGVPPQEVCNYLVDNNVALEQIFPIFTNKNVLCSFSDENHSAPTMLYVSGFDQRLSDCVGGCCRLLQGLKCNRIRCQCGKCPSLHQTSRPDDAQKHPGNKKSSRDPQRQRKHLGIHAGSV